MALEHATLEHCVGVPSQWREHKMITLIILKAFSLVSLNSDGSEINAKAPWVNVPAITHYAPTKHSTHAKTPWAHESLSTGLPAITSKGAL
jgi:hypothetical protein